MKIALQFLLHVTTTLCISLIFSVFWFALAASEGVEHVFPANAETTYKWSTEVSTGVTIPGSNDNHASYFAFNGNLRVRTDTTNKVLFKIENMSHSAYNGPVGKNKAPKDGHIFVEKCKDSCGTTFAAVYEKGQITSVEISESDKVYVRNTKRAIMSQFQLDTEHIQPSEAFTSFERGVTGLCHIKQSVHSHQDDDHIFLRKFFDNNNCTENPEKKDNLGFHQCGQSTWNPAAHTTERTYKLSKNGNLFVNKIESRSAILTQPQGLDTESYFHVTKQTMEIISSEPAQNDEWATGKSISTSLVFEFPDENLETGEDIDLSFGKIVYEPEITVNKTMVIFKKLAERVDLKTAHTLRVEQLREFSIQREMATWYLRSMNTETFKTLGELIAKTEDKTTRRVALDMLPRVGTLAAVRTIMDLKGKVQDLEFLNMLMEMPFHLRHRSLELIQVTTEMMKFGTNPELLAFGTIVGEVCENTNACPNISTIVKLSIDEIQAQEDYDTKMMIIQFLGNIHLETVAEHLEPIIRDKVNYPHNLRFAAVWAAYHTQVKQPDKAYKFYWPILEDDTEHHDMRQAALTVLLHSNPTTERFLNLLWYIYSTDDPDMYNMFYTTVKSLLDTKHPCFQQLSLSAEEIYKLMPERKTPTFASFNMITDYKDPKSGNGLKFQTVMISDVKTGFPNILYVDVVPHYNGLIGNALSLHLRVDGSAIRETIGIRRWTPDNDTYEFPILQVLQSLGVTTRENAPTNIEIIVKRNGRTVACECMKQFHMDILFELLKWRTFGSWFEEFDIPSTPSSPVKFRFNGINGEILDRNSIYETVVANDAGIPVTLFMKEPGLLSLEGDIQILGGILNSSLETNLTLRYLGDKSQGIYSLNPVMGVWQGVSRSRIQDVLLQSENKYSTVADLERLVLSIEWKNNDTVPFFALNHVETETFVEGDGSSELTSLDVMCPQCNVSHVVNIENPKADIKKSDDSQFEFMYAMFDCENPEELNKERFYNALTSTDNKNTRSSMWMKPLLGLIAMADLYARTPTTGSCGQSLHVKPIGKASRFEIILQPKKSEKTIDINYKDSDGKLLKSLTGTYDLKNTFENVTGFKTFTLQLRHKVDNKPFQMTCIRTDFSFGRDGDFNLLYEPLIPSKKLQFEYNVGVSHDGNCPERNESSILISGTSSWNKMDNKNFAMCKEDRGDNSLYPATENCVHSAQQFWYARKVSMDVNMNIELDRFEKSAVATIHRMLPDTVPERLLPDFKLDMEFNGDGKVAVWMTGAENPGKWHDIGHPFSYTNFLDNIDSYRSLLIKLQTCYIAGNNVYTYDGTSIEYNAVPKWTLLTAHCGDLPTFAVFARRIEGSDMLALRFHVISDVIEVTQTESTPDITINGEPYESFNETSLPDFLWLTVENDVIYMTGVSINTVHIYMSKKYITITTYSDFAGWTCGLCGDFNQWPETSSNFPGPDGKPVKLEDVTRVYTLP